MEIKVGGRYKRVKMDIPHKFTFLGQEIIVTGFDEDGDPEFKMKLPNGGWQGGWVLTVEIFKQNFKPFNMKMRNK